MANTRNHSQTGSGAASKQRLVKKRRRLVVSCTECHRRKQKCDRGLPCANCRSRNKESSCVYETGTPIGGGENDTSPSFYNSNSSEATTDGATQRAQSLSSVAANWGYSQTGVSTIGFLRKIETTDPDHQSSTPSYVPSTNEGSSFTLKEKYKGLIRQLPPQPFIDKLVEIYMVNFNPQYYIIDPGSLVKQLADWRGVPFEVISAAGPHGLSADLRVFPAVLFQMMAIGLLVLPQDLATEYDSLKYAADMTWEDLARDYSESAVAIVKLFGKKGLSITGVEAQFLRTVFTKYIADVTESWHALAESIRDAQELGLHTDALDPKPADTTLESTLENQWMIQRRRKLYMYMAAWDINTCLVLGRPSIINSDEKLPSLPIDVTVPRDMRTTPLIARDDDREPPTPLVHGLWLYKLSLNLRGVLRLDNDGPFPKDWSKVDQLHASMLAMEERKPAIFRTENPDTRWDDLLETAWIRGMRFYMAQLYHFGLMCLHRRYMFHRKESRIETLKASLSILKLHKGLFDNAPVICWKNHTLFFGTFDALVQLAAIYILFPRDHPELRSHARQHFDWTIERFTRISETNALAQSAQGVLKAIQAKFIKAVESNGDFDGYVNVASTASEITCSTPSEVASSSNSAGKDGHSARGSLPSVAPSVEGSLYPPPPPPPPPPPLTAQHEWTATPGREGSIDPAYMTPLFPISDLVFNDLMAEPKVAALLGPGEMPGGENGSLGGEDDLWQFGGGVGDDTLWRLLNQY